MICLHASLADLLQFRFTTRMITAIMLGLFAGSNVFGEANRDSSPELKVGSKAFTESVILGEMLSGCFRFRAPFH
jgi:glycine betaine/choline ABC-type transport system substrate-binding protein